MLARRTTTLGLAALFTLLLAAPALADDDGKSGVLTVWNVTEGEATVGIEKLRVVNRGSTLFLTGKRLLKKGAAKASRKTHLQRVDGQIFKYRREELARNGKGIFAFKKGGALRVVGVNQKMKPSEHPALDRLIWDGKIWHQLALWANQVAGDAVTIKYFDISKKTSGEATLTRGATFSVANDKGESVEVTAWALSGVPTQGLELVVDGKKKLAGIRHPDRRMLRKGWAWEVATPPPEDGEDDDDAKPGKKVPSDDDDDGDDGGDDDDEPLDPGP